MATLTPSYSEITNSLLEAFEAPNGANLPSAAVNKLGKSIQLGGRAVQVYVDLGTTEVDVSYSDGEGYPWSTSDLDRAFQESMIDLFPHYQSVDGGDAELEIVGRVLKALSDRAIATLDDTSSVDEVWAEVRRYLGL